MKVLNVISLYSASDGTTLVSQLFPEAEIVTVKMEELADLQPEYDLVFCAHVLQYAFREDVQTLVNRMASGVKDLGELWLITPDLEWACKEAEKDMPSPVVLFVLFGSKEQPHHTGIKLDWLRKVVENAGLIPRRVHQGLYKVMRDDKEIFVPQNTVYAMKYEGLNADKASWEDES
jgi:hypothetical protein